MAPLFVLYFKSPLRTLRPSHVIQKYQSIYIVLGRDVRVRSVLGYMSTEKRPDWCHKG
jgi:hypothetical protein